MPMVQLTSRNYQRWSFDTQQTLGAKELWKTVTGDNKLEEDETKVKERDAWYTKDFAAKAVIARTLDDEHHAFVRSCGTAQEMWNKLKSIHQSSVNWNVDQLSQEYNLLKFNPGTRVNQYFSQLSVILQRLEDAKEKVSDRLVLAKVLTDLPPEYDSLKQSWRLMASQDKEKKLTLDELQAQLNALEKEADAKVMEDPGSSKALKFGNKGTGNEEQSAQVQKEAVLWKVFQL